MINIISENINEEFARKIKEILYEEIDKNSNGTYELENEIEDLELQIDQLEDISNRHDELGEKIEGLRKYYYENTDGTDFYEGIYKALDIIDAIK